MVDLPARTPFAPDARAQGVLRVTLQPMRVSDVPAVIKLERRSYSLPWSASAYVTEINNPSAEYLVAETGEHALAGYGGVWVVMDEMHITTLVVDPDLRGRRIGERLLIALLQEGLRLGAHRATLEVRQHNPVAHALYLKYGFKDVAIRKGYYSDNGENAVIMWAENMTAPEYRASLRQRLGQIERLHGEPPPPAAAGIAE